MCRLHNTLTPFCCTAMTLGIERRGNIRTAASGDSDVFTARWRLRGPSSPAFGICPPCRARLLGALLEICSLCRILRDMAGFRGGSWEFAQSPAGCHATSTGACALGNGFRALGALSARFVVAGPPCRPFLMVLGRFRLTVQADNYQSGSQRQQLQPAA